MPATSQSRPGDQIDVQAGAKVIAGQTADQDTRGHGGRIFLIAGCQTNIAGLVSSQGHDPGADLVHIEGCQVHIASTGVVESTGPGHQPTTPNSCDNIDDANTSPGGDAGEVLRDHPADSTVCVEIWARHFILDAGGEVNADFASAGGTEGHGWIDIFAETDIVLNGTVGGPWAVHSNSGLGSDTGGDVTIKAKNSFISMSGNAVQANALLNGGTGGHVIVEAGGNVDFTNARSRLAAKTPAEQLIPVPSRGPSRASQRAH